MKHGLRQIRAFVEIAAQKNFSKAAEKLCISASTLTLQIQQLEAELGVTLFERDKHQVSITFEGQQLLIPLKSILDEYDYAMHLSRNMADNVLGVITVAVLPTIASTLLPNWIKIFKTTYPKVKIVVYDLNANEIQEAVKTGVVNIGIGTAEQSDAAIDNIRLFEDDLELFVSKENELASFEKIYMRDVLHYPQILTLPGSSVVQIFMKNIEQLGYNIQNIDITCQVRYLSTALGLVNVNTGVAILPKSTPVSNFFPNVVRRKIIDFKPSRTIFILQPKNCSNATLSEAFKNIVLENI